MPTCERALGWDTAQPAAWERAAPTRAPLMSMLACEKGGLLKYLQGKEGADERPALTQEKRPTLPLIRSAHTLGAWLHGSYKQA